MYHVSTQGVDERMINVRYYYYRKHKAENIGVVLLFLQPWQGQFGSLPLGHLGLRRLSSQCVQIISFGVT